MSFLGRSFSNRARCGIVAARFSPVSPCVASVTTFAAPPALPFKLSYESAIGKPDFRIFFNKPDGSRISPWHDIPLKAGGDSRVPLYHYVNEIPRGTTAKMEICTKTPDNPIKQDVKKGNLRFFKYGNIPFNYGALCQTYEDPKHVHPDTGFGGDNDPVDVVELSGFPMVMGGVYAVRVLGLMALIDEGETDWKILAIAESPNAPDPAIALKDAEAIVRDWFKNYKVPDGKPQNQYAFNEQIKSQEYALQVIADCHNSWQELSQRKREL